MITGRLAVLGERDFRRFYLGYLASLLGTAAAPVAIAFAVLADGGTAADLGFVLAAGIAPQVLSLIAGGVAADRLGRRRVMLAADVARGAAQAALALALLTGRPAIWVFVAAAMARGAGEGFFAPALSGLTVEMVAPGGPRERDGGSASAGLLGDADALLGVATSVASVAGPALAGLLTAAVGPALVVALDAASYGASVLALSLLRAGPPRAAFRPRAAAAPERGQPPAGPSRGARRTFMRDLAEGWAEFRSRRWLVVTTVQFTAFNLFTWGPFLLLGPVLAKQGPGGAGAWGATMACYGAGAVLGGLLALGRRPARPILAAEVTTLGYALPCALLALRAPEVAVAAGALAAGMGSELGGAFETTVMQQQIPAEALARVAALQTVIAFAFGPLAFAMAGPVAAVVGLRPVLAFGAAWSVACTVAALATPAVRRAPSTIPREPS